MKICNVCKTVLEDSAAYCPRCNSQSFAPFQTKRCPFCNSVVAVGTIVCSNCHKILPPEEYIEMKFTQPVVQPIYVQPIEAPKTYVAPRLSEDIVPREQPASRPQQTAPTYAPAPNYDFAKGREFDQYGRPFDRPIERKQDSNPMDSIILESENKNFGRPEQYAELYPNDVQPNNQNAYANTPFKPIAVKDTLDNLDDDSQTSGKVLGFSESNAKLNEKINSKISKSDRENGKKDKHRKNDTDRLFGSINDKYDSERIVPQVMSKEEAERQNRASSQKSVIVDQNGNNSRNMVSDEEIVKNAFSNMSGERTVYKNECASPTYIYNQIFPNPTAETNHANSAVFESMADGAPSIAPVNEKNVKPTKQRISAGEIASKPTKQRTAEREVVAKPTKPTKPIKQRTAGSGIAAMLSLIFITVGFLASLFLVEINFVNDQITGVQLAAASLGDAVFNMFPSNYWTISENGFIIGLNLTIYELISPLYLASAITSILAITASGFCFKPSKAKKIILLVLSLMIFFTSLTITLALLFIFNYATIGFGSIIFTVTAFISLMTLIIGYKHRV